MGLPERFRTKNEATLYELPNEKRTQCHVLVDPELSCIVSRRNEGSEFRLWLYAHHLGDGSGWIKKDELFSKLLELGIVTSKSTFNDILKRGKSLYWRRSYKNSVVWVRPTGSIKLSKRLTTLELKIHPNLIGTNRPGMRRVWLDLSGSLKSVMARCYGAWFAVKAEKTGFVEISRQTLEALWGRSKKNLLQWEALAGIETQPGYAEHHNIHSELVPAHAYLCVDRSGNEFASWRTVNRYIPKPVNQNLHGGQRRKVRAAVNSFMNKSEPATVSAGGRRRVERTGRIYFTNRDSKNGSIIAHRSIDRHLRKHGDIFERRHYAYLGIRYGVHIREYSTGEQRRTINVGRDFRKEQTLEFARRRLQYRIGWSYRCA
jgi:hypothetical protein